MTTSITDTIKNSLNAGDKVIRAFVLVTLPLMITALGTITDDAQESEIELALAEIKKAKGPSRLSKQLNAATLALFACGYRTADRIKAQLTSKATAGLLDRAMSFMSVYKLISRLYGAGVHHSLKDSRAQFRTLFEGDSKSSAAQRAIFEFICGQPVSDVTWIHFVEGEKDEDKNWTIKPQLFKYEQSAKLDRIKKTANAEKLRFTADDVLAFESAYIGRPEVKAEAEFAAQAASHGLQPSEFASMLAEIPAGVLLPDVAAQVQVAA